MPISFKMYSFLKVVQLFSHHVLFKSCCTILHIVFVNRVVLKLMPGLFRWWCWLQQGSHYWANGWRSCHSNHHCDHFGDAEEETVHLHSSWCNWGKKLKRELLFEASFYAFLCSSAWDSCCFTKFPPAFEGGCSCDTRGAPPGQDAAERLRESNLQILWADAELNKLFPNVCFRHLFPSPPQHLTLSSFSPCL